jgi:hypothetical protein
LRWKQNVQICQIKQSFSLLITQENYHHYYSFVFIRLLTVKQIKK